MLNKDWDTVASSSHLMMTLFHIDFLHPSSRLLVHNTVLKQITDCSECRCMAKSCLIESMRPCSYKALVLSHRSIWLYNWDTSICSAAVHAVPGQQFQDGSVYTWQAVKNTECKQYFPALAIIPAPKDFKMMIQSIEVYWRLMLCFETLVALCFTVSALTVQLPRISNISNKR